MRSEFGAQLFGYKALIHIVWWCLMAFLIPFLIPDMFWTILNLNPRILIGCPPRWDWPCIVVLPKAAWTSNAATWTMGWFESVDWIWFDLVLNPLYLLLEPDFFLRKYEFERIFAARNWPWLPLTEITLENGSMLMTHDHRFTILSHRLISSSSLFHIIMWYYNYDSIFCPTYDSIFSSQCRAAVEVDESWSSMTLQERQGRTSRD